MTLSVLDAAYHTVHNYPGGSEALGLRMSPAKSGTTLSQEVRPPVGCTAKLGINTAAQIIDLSGDYTIAHAFCARVGGMFVPLPQVDGTNTKVLPAVSRLAAEFGQLVAQVTDVADDGRVSLNELRQVERKATELMVALQSTLAVIRAMHDPRG